MAVQGSGVRSLRARAKVNLYLHVTGRRPDGYHLLDSLMVFPACGDRLDIAPASEAAPDSLSLELAGSFAEALRQAGGEAEDNLVLRAARLLAGSAGVAPAARLRLTKNLPVVAGIGGGSADAAAALRGLSRLWGLDLPSGRLAELALELGADVPPCLDSRPVFVRGIGEDLTPAPALPAFWLLLVNPGVPVSTPQVFKARSGAFSSPVATSMPEGAAPLGDLDGLLAFLAATRNDLEPPALALAPEVGQVLETLSVQPGCRLARMSGSGATCFGLFAEAAEAKAAAVRLADLQPTWWCAAAPVEGGGEATAI